ncbi:MAG: hypothetical protein IPI79_06100, partial [Moraxellaceae bacterium]|nr:hypothetical protein [Moraxellaceae bacterium]
QTNFLRVKNVGHIVNLASNSNGLALDDKGRIWNWNHSVAVSEWIGIYRKYYLSVKPSIKDVVRIYSYYPTSFALTKNGDVYAWEKYQDKKAPYKLSWQWK